MILTNRIENKKSFRLDFKTILSAAVLLAGAFLIYYFFTGWVLVNDQGHQYFCDAETVRGNQFLGIGQKFSKASTQSNERAFSGKYSSKLSAASETQYGFGTNIENPKPGERIEVSVWTLSEGNSNGKLAISANQPGLFYRDTDQYSELGKGGWRKLQMVVDLPDDKTIELLKIYVYSTGENAIYFDDFAISRGEAELVLPSDFQAQTVKIELSEIASRKLEKKREDAFEEGFLVTREDDWVKGRIVDEDYYTKINLRLKGDILDHLSGKKWSFRVKTRGESAWNRMMTFNFQNPKTRDFLDEWVLHKFFEKEDVLTPRYEFLNLELNNQPLGIYAMEEHFDKQLVEYKKRREGPIMKFSEDGEWEGRKRETRATGSMKNWDQVTDFKEASDIKTFKEGKTFKSEVLTQQFELAQNLMLAYKEGELQARDIFDLELMARYFAIIDIMGAHHSIYWTNQRFYYNPVISRLEPVGFDGFSNGESWIKTFIGWQMFHPKSANYELYVRLFQDEDFMEKYVANLLRMSDEVYLKTLFEELRSDILAREQFIKQEFTNYKFDEQRFLNRAKEINTIILPYNNISLKCFKDPNQSGVYDVINYHGLPLKIIGFGRQADDVVKIKEQTLYAHKSGRVPIIEQIETEMREARFIFFQPLGLDSIFSSEIIKWTRPQIFSVNATLFEDIKPQTNDLYLVKDDLIRFKAGAVETSEDIIIPSGFRVEFEAGVQLNLTKGARFISRSPVFLFGTEENPIKIYSSDRSARGFTVLEAKEASEMRYAKFDHLNTLSFSGWNLTGAVTFYASDVIIKNCIIQNNHCEDALNIIRSTFEIQNSIIQHTPFDAFDADFCSGTIRNSISRDSGNDGLDFSGSTINIIDCQLEDNRDKGISVGEESTVTVRGTSINGAIIAIASKDNSYLRLESIDIKNCNQGFAAYQKKPEYGPSKIIVLEYRAENIKHLYTLGTACELRLKDKVVIGE